MAQPAARTCLAAEAREVFGLLGKRGRDHLHGDHAIGAR
jgi:hypothetical protein